MAAWHSYRASNDWNFRAIWMKHFSILVAMLLILVSPPGTAADTPLSGAASKPLNLVSTVPQGVFTVFPKVGYANQTRSVMLILSVSLCESTRWRLDTNLMLSDSEVWVRSRSVPELCAPLIGGIYTTIVQTFEFTPTRAGIITVFWEGLLRPGGKTESLTIQTLPEKIASTYDANGMWYDSATNGSGIALHHRRTGSDAAFGTWFMYNNAGEPRWYSLQSASWQADGNVLEGFLLGFDGMCQTPSLAACPARSRPQETRVPSSFLTFASPPAFVRITFQSATRARAEVSSLDGTRLFSSELTKLAF